jgi:hypothetical protein
MAVRLPLAIEMLRSIETRRLAGEYKVQADEESKTSIVDGFFPTWARPIT